MNDVLLIAAVGFIGGGITGAVVAGALKRRRRRS
jgi:uncharacterized protein involved in exopolysaccharide biosynthesis